MEITEATASEIDADLLGKPSVLYLKEKGNDAFRSGEYQEALDFYTRALERLDYSDRDELKAQVFSNRAACYSALGDYDSTIEDCNDSILVDPNYAKAYLRRGLAFEHKSKYQKAYSDLEKAVSLDESLRDKYASKLSRLKRLGEQEFEREKAEMMDKLKNLGNSLLGKVGLSLDNFKVQKNPETGSYNIQFQN